MKKIISLFILLLLFMNICNAQSESRFCLSFDTAKFIRYNFFHDSISIELPKGFSIDSSGNCNGDVACIFYDNFKFRITMSFASRGTDTSNKHFIDTVIYNMQNQPPSYSDRIVNIRKVKIGSREWTAFEYERDALPLSHAHYYILSANRFEFEMDFRILDKDKKLCEPSIFYLLNSVRYNY